MGTSAYFKYGPQHNFQGKKVLNLGCGFAQYFDQNVINLDAHDCCKPDIVWDLEKTPLPFEDETFDLIFANHILEHIHNWWDVVDDCARMLKKTGILEIWVPGKGSDSMQGYRDHVTYITDESFYGTHNMIRAGGNAWAYSRNVDNAKWLRLVNRHTRNIPNWWIEKMPKSIKTWMCHHLRNVSLEEGFFFRKATEAQMESLEKLIKSRNEELENANKNRNRNRNVSMSAMRKAEVH